MPVRGRLVFKAHIFLYHSTLDLRVIKKKKRKGVGHQDPFAVRCTPRQEWVIKEKNGLQGSLAHQKTPPPRTLQ